MNAAKLFKTALKAFIIGSTMTVPGFSGGSMAMILGEYDTLIESVPGLLRKKEFRESFLYLFIFLIAGLAGVFIISKPLSILLENHFMAVMYFFLGAVIATIPSIIRSSGITPADCSIHGILSYAACIVAGCIIVFSIRLIPEGVFTPSLTTDFISVLEQIIGGILLSIGFVLPGISISYLLVVTGLYGTVLNSLSNLNILPMIPLGIGGVIGVFTLTGFLTWAMRKHSKITYMVILGFLIGSIASVFPGLPAGSGIITCLVSFIAGGLSIFVLSKAESQGF